jgi:hypothetical protein
VRWSLRVPVFFLVLGFGWALFGGGAPLGAQTGAEETTLDRVEALMDGGRLEAARSLLEAWWESEWGGGEWESRQRGLWLRALLTVDPAMAEVDFQRLVLEYPAGPFADDALHRLGLWAVSRGDLQDARSHFTTLARDYPGSPYRQEARAWLREHAGATRLPSPPSPGEVAPSDPDVSGQVASGGPVSVQLGAFRSLERARTLSRRVQEAGFEPRLVTVPGSDLYRVRLGRFDGRPPAEALARELAGEGFESTIVTDARSEEEVR